MSATGKTITKHGNWSIAEAPCRSGYYAWAKVGEISSDNPVDEPGEVWFEFGDIPDEARGKLLRELGLLS